MRGFLKLSNSTPLPTLFYLLGELPIEGTLHIRTLGLFHNICTNPDTTVFTMVAYILKMCSSSSTTWSNHIQLLCKQYGLPSPLSVLMSAEAWSKEAWMDLVKTRVTVWHETRQRALALTNTKMTYLNVQLHGLSGRPHPVIQNIERTQDAKKLRLHLKFLSGDYLTNERLARDQPGRSPACLLCGAAIDNIEHVLVSCRATKDIRDRLLPDLLNTVAIVQPACQILDLPPAPHILAQFVVDCSSFNLPDKIRIPTHNPGICEIFRLSRDWCFGISSERFRLLGSCETGKEDD